MTHPDAFLQAILAAPADDGPRLVYADYLEERGDPRGEFIRVQVALAPMPTADELLIKLRALDAPGDFEADADGIHWMAEFRTSEDEEPHDRAWEINGEAAERIDPMLPPGWTRDGLWSDNDSVGFSIRPAAQQAELRRRERELFAAAGGAQQEWATKPGHDLMIAGREWLSYLPWFSRGLLGRVECPAAAWLAHGPAVVRAAPVTRVGLTDRQPHCDERRPNPWMWGVEREWHDPADPNARYYLPLSLVDRIPAVAQAANADVAKVEAQCFPTRAAALDALSAACLAWAKAQPAPRPAEVPLEWEEVRP